MDRRAIAIILIVCSATFLFFSHRVPVPDVAWLIEGARRWIDGAELYRDVREVNPPLVFYEMLVLTGGQLTPKTYVAGVCIAMALSALFVLRCNGAKAALPALGAMIFAGFTAFGQRDHLALIFVIPFILISGSRRERAAAGIWAFFGVGLKPYLLPILLFPILVRWWKDRRILVAENIALAACCLLYLIAAKVLHPLYFSEMIPLGRFVYGAYGMERPHLTNIATTIVLLLVCFAAKNKVVAASVLGALASYYFQWKFWPYHFIPAVGLGFLLCMTEEGRPFRIVAILLAMVQLTRLTDQRAQRAPIPQGQTATFLIAHPSGAYPTSLLCGVKNASRYPAIWTIPGAWNIYTDKTRSDADRAKAKAILIHERGLIREDILTMKPDVIFADVYAGRQYFDRPFDYMKFVGPLPEYRKVGTKFRYDVWARKPVNPQMCTEKL